MAFADIELIPPLQFARPVVYQYKGSLQNEMPLKWWRILPVSESVRAEKGVWQSPVPPEVLFLQPHQNTRSELNVLDMRALGFLCLSVCECSTSILRTSPQVGRAKGDPLETPQSDPIFRGR